jgi:uncharacterized protein involved in outer membrane biogenesis
MERKHRLRRILLSVPAITAAGLLALYALVGFFAAPAVLRSQLERRVPEWLDQRLTIGAVRFNPFTFRLRIDDLSLASRSGEPLAGWHRAVADLELRSLIDRGWHFAEATLESPFVNVVVARDGSSNVGRVIERLRGDATTPAGGRRLPPFAIDRLRLAGGRLELADRRLEEPTIFRVEPMHLAIDALSSRSDRPAPYTLSALSSERTALELRGTLALEPMALHGVLALVDLPVRTLARGLSRRIGLASPQGRLDLAGRFAVRQGADGGLTATAEQLELQVPGLAFALPGAAEPLLAVETVALRQGRIDLDRRSATFGELHIAEGRLAVAMDAQGRADWARLARSEAAASGPDPTTARPVTSEGADSTARPAAASGEPWQIAISRIVVERMAVAYRDPAHERRVDVDALRLEAAAETSFGPAGWRVALAQPRVALRSARLASKPASLELPEASLEADGGSLDGATGRLEIAFEAPRIAAPQGLSASLGADALHLGSTSVAGARIDSTLGPDGLAAKVSALDGAVADLAWRRPSIGVGAGRATVEAGSLDIALAEGPADVSASGVQATLADARLRPADDAPDRLRIKKASLAGGTLRLHDRLARAERIAVEGGSATIGIDAEGRLVLPIPFAGQPPGGAASAASASAGSPERRTDSPGAADAGASDGWRFALGSAQLGDFALAFSDERRAPPRALQLHVASARATRLDTGSPEASDLAVQAALSSGGSVRVNGSVRLRDPMADLAVEAQQVALAPLQPWLDEFADLRLASGTASVKGMLRYGGEGSARLRYQGRAALDDVQLAEREPDRPLLGWQSLATDDLVLTIAPNRAEIGDVRLHAPAARLLIAEDSTLNVADVLRQQPKPGAAETRAGAAQASADAAGTSADAAAHAEGQTTPAAFPLRIERLAVTQGALDFTDRSLTPHFSTRMHALHGVVTGIGTDPDRSARLQLEAQVDRYGSAKISGKVSLFQPKEDSAVDMVFRNIDMASLSPYIAKFAGYRIADGRLDLDLHYEVENGLLDGRNEIVLRQVKLGEKVDSPSALDIPIELALAVLKDRNGVIDIGLPVSGNLDSPKFDYGAVIRKAIGRVLGNIVSAPFKALAGLFGSGGEDARLGSVDFEPGSVSIAPPQREKLDAVARALTERPQLRLVVPPTYSSAEDRRALKSRTVRAELLRRMGTELAPAEEPGPIDTDDPRAQQAIRALFSARYAPAVFDELARAWPAGGLPTLLTSEDVECGTP